MNLPATTPRPASPGGGGRPAPADLPPISAWQAAARKTAWIPSAFAAYHMSLEDAAARLRAPVSLLERLIDEGLPAAGAPVPRVDSNDIFNLGLELGWRGALPVVGFTGALRWLTLPLGALLEPQTWHCQFSVAASPGARDVRLALPFPEVYAGRWAAETGPPPPPGPRRDRVDLAPGNCLQGVVRLQGRHQPVRGEAIGRIVRDVLSSGMRWAKLPLTLQNRPAVVSALGYANCVSVSLSVAEKLRGAGFAARTRRGWLIAPVSTGHSWVEVQDEDGKWRVIDPVLVLLRRRLEAVERPRRSASPQTGAGEWDLADGLLVNRVLPTALPGDKPLCVAADGGAVDVGATFRKLVPETVTCPGERGAAPAQVQAEQERRPARG